MTNIKKFITIVLCMLLAISSVVTVSAEESKFSGIVSKKVEVLGNGDVEVLIDIAGNPGISALKLEVKYDSSVLTLKENGFKDTGLLVGNLPTTLTLNPFRLSWNHYDGTPVNNYQNGTIGKLYFTMKDNFCGSTDIMINVISAQTIVNSQVVRPPAMESGVISVTRPKLAIRDGVAIANSVNGETLIIASYDKDRMIDCKIYPNSTGNVEIVIADVLNTSGATKVKAFLWENLETLVPVCECTEELYITRPNLAIKDGVAFANSLNGETLIIASYDEDRMIDFKTYPNSTGDVEITIADVLNTSGATKVKVFLWENLETLVPVCDCAEEEL